MRDGRPIASVVIPAFNAEATIASASRSVLRQTHTDLEVIVVDDGSSDRTGEIVGTNRDPRVQLVSQRNQGVAAARNAGIACARGQYIAFLDSDDLWLPTYLELAVDALAGTKDPGFAYTDAYAFDATAGKVGRRGLDGDPPPVLPPSSTSEFLLELLKRNFIFSSAVVPRRVLTAVGGFDQRAAPAEDYGLWLRIVARGYQPMCIPGKHASLNKLALLRGERASLRGIPMELLPTAAHGAVVAARLRQIEREIRVLEGSARLRTWARRLRHAAGRLRMRAGFDGARCKQEPPPDVRAAFPDLTAV
jgi:glycosyltransferase involved in cell wall biosynthesis